MVPLNGPHNTRQLWIVLGWTLCQGAYCFPNVASYLLDQMILVIMG